MVIPSVRIFHRHPSFKEKPFMVIWLMSDDFNIVWWWHSWTWLATQFWIFVEHQYSLFVLGHPRLQWSFCLAIVYKITLSATDFVHYSRRWTVGFILQLWSWKKTVDGFLRLVRNLIHRHLVQLIDQLWSREHLIAISQTKPQQMKPLKATRYIEIGAVANW